MGDKIFKYQSDLEVLERQLDEMKGVTVQEINAKNTRLKALITKKNSAQVNINQMNADIESLKKKIEDERLTQIHLTKHLKEAGVRSSQHDLTIQQKEKKINHTVAVTSTLSITETVWS